MVKNLPAMQETQVRWLGGEDPLEKEMATHCIILSEKFHKQRSLTAYSLWWGHKETRLTHQHFGNNSKAFTEASSGGGWGGGGGRCLKVSGSYLV